MDIARRIDWQKVYGTGEKKDWKGLIKEDVDTLPINYDVIGTHGWGKLTYEQVAEGLLPRYEGAKPIPADDD